ncbi:MAG TPA: aquaporin [Dehalococcoidia bacterium]|nr:aquaporin [Dehalococcoidia bacterium]
MAVLFPPIKVRWGTREVPWTWVPANVREMVEAARPVFAEFLGSLTFVFLAGSLLVHVAERTHGSIGLLTVALGTAVAYGIIVSVFHPFSGGHINPAVTLGVMAARRLPLLEGLLYMAGQLVGGLLGALMLNFVYRGMATDAARSAVLTFSDRYHGSWPALFTGGFLEAALTFVLVLAFLSTLVDPRGQRAFGGLAVGLVMFVAMLLAFPLTGAALNVARVFATAAVANYWADFAMYWLGLAGGLVAGLVYALVLAEREQPETR